MMIKGKFNKTHVTVFAFSNTMSFIIQTFSSIIPNRIAHNQVENLIREILKEELGVSSTLSPTLPSEPGEVEPKLVKAMSTPERQAACVALCDLIKKRLRDMKCAQNRYKLIVQVSLGELDMQGIQMKTMGILDASVDRIIAIPFKKSTHLWGYVVVILVYTY
jgi:Tctex-1 family